MAFKRTNVVEARGSAGRKLMKVAVILSIPLVLFALWNTPSNEPIRFDVSLAFNYEGQIDGSFTLSYEWTSNDVASKTPGTYDITWTQDIAHAEGSPSYPIDNFIKDHFASIVVEQSLWSIDSSGGWEINILQLASSFVNLNYAIVGSNDTVNSLVISASINKSLDDFTGELFTYGVTSLGVTISAKITIPGNMLMDLINGIAGIAKGFISLIVGTGSQIIQLLTLP